MHLLPVLADPFDQLCFHEAVNIFVFIRDLKSALFYILSDFSQALYNIILFFTG